MASQKIKSLVKVNNEESKNFEMEILDEVVLDKTLKVQ